MRLARALHADCSLKSISTKQFLSACCGPVTSCATRVRVSTPHCFELCLAFHLWSHRTQFTPMTVGCFGNSLYADSASRDPVMSSLKGGHGEGVGPTCVQLQSVGYIVARPIARKNAFGVTLAQGWACLFSPEPQVSKILCHISV